MNTEVEGLQATTAELESAITQEESNVELLRARSLGCNSGGPLVFSHSVSLNDLASKVLPHTTFLLTALCLKFSYVECPWMQLYPCADMHGVSILDLPQKPPHMLLSDGASCTHNGLKAVISRTNT